MDAARPIVIIGAGGHGRVVFDVCRAARLTVAGFVDRALPTATEALGVPLLGSDELLSSSDFFSRYAFVPGLSNRAVRRSICSNLIAVGGMLATVVHPKAILSPLAEIGAGTLLVAGAVVNSGARVGRFCIVNTSAVVDHDCVLEDGVQVNPNATLCGTVHCGADAVVGAGAVVRQGLSIGAGATVGAGAVVVKSVGERTVVAGNPACPLGVLASPE